MERIRDINRERILWCCTERQITPDQLARDVGVSQTAMERFLADETGLTFAQLQRVAEYFGRGVLFFIETGPVDVDRVHTPQFRTLTGQKPNLSFRIRKLIEQVERQRERYLALRDELDVEFPVFEPRSLEQGDVQATATAAREWLRLRAENSFDAYRAAVERKGILVFRSNGYAGAWQMPKESPILGFSLYDVRCPVIFVRKTRWETQQTFTLMHELGHLLLHRESSIDDADDMQARHGLEQQANEFAGLVLVPNAVLAAIRDDERPDRVGAYDTWLLRERRQLGVSTEVILRRLLDAGRLGQAEYTAYRQHVATMSAGEDEQAGNRAYRYREPKHIFGDLFVRTVLQAFHARRVTATKASSYLDGLKLSDLHLLERHIAGA